MKADSTGRDLQVTSGEESSTIHNVLVGEVWFSDGQSYMGYTVRGMANRLPERKALADAAELPEFRYRKINEKDSLAPKDDITGGSWLVYSPKIVQHFSGVGFIFARGLHIGLKVFIGIIDCS